MTQDEFRREKLYLAAMSFAYKLLSEDRITEDNYYQFDTKMKAKYGPKIGTLLVEKRLLEGRFRALLDVRKEAENGRSIQNRAEESA